MGIEVEEFVRDTRSDLAYILAAHADNFLSALTTCFRKSLGHWSRLQLAMKAAGGRWAAPLRIDGLYRDETARLFDEVNVLTVDGSIGCLEDTLRDSIVNAWITAFRKQFVDRMVDRGVYPEVAEYWWEKAIWDTDEERSAAERISSETRLQLQAAQGFSKFWRLRLTSIWVDTASPDRGTFFLQLQEETKSKFRRDWADRIVSEGAEAAKRSMQQQMGIWNYRVLSPEAAANARLAGQRYVKQAVEAQTRAQATALAENSAVLAQQAITGGLILFRESAFEGQEREVLKQYREIVECMRILNRRDPIAFAPPSGGTVKGIYANPVARARLIELCKQGQQRTEAPTPEGGEQPAISEAQCATLHTAYREQCAAMAASYRPENCKPPAGKTGFGYSGCWEDPRGCMNYGISCALPCNASAQRLSCGKAIIAKYIKCQTDCNDKLVRREFRAAHEGALICGRACDDAIRADCKACDAGKGPPSAAAAATPHTGSAPLPSSAPAARIVSPNRASKVERSSTGAVRITASAKEGGSDFAPGPNNNAPRLMQPVSGDWTVETRVRFAPASMFQGAGILVCFGPTAESTDCLRAIERQYYRQGNVVNSFAGQKAFAGPVTHLRLRKIGREYVASYSADGQTWLDMGRRTESREATFVGLMALRQAWDGKQDLSSVAEFDGLRITPIHEPTGAGR
jgi:hypothetical protein